jgi:hypothetical protein
MLISNLQINVYRQNLLVLHNQRAHIVACLLVVGDMRAIAFGKRFRIPTAAEYALHLYTSKLRAQSTTSFS